MFYYIFSTTYQRIGDLFCHVIFLDFGPVWTRDDHCTARLRQKCKKLSIHRGVTNKDCIRANKFKAFCFLQPIQLTRKTFYETFKKRTKHLHKSFQSKQNIAQMKTEKCLFMRYLLTLKDVGRGVQNDPLVRRLAAIHFKDTVARSLVPQNYFRKVYSTYRIVASSNVRY